MQRVLLFVLYFLCADSSFAQYYTPGGGGFERTELRYGALGVMRRTFSPRESNPLPDTSGISYNAIFPYLSLRQGPLDLTLGYGRFSLRGVTRTTVTVGALASHEVPLSFSSPHAFMMPVLLAIDFTRVEGIGPTRENFNIASFGAGVALKYRYSTPAWFFSMQVGEAAHFSTEGFSAGTGFSAMTTAELLFVLYDIRIGDGLVFGYRFHLQTWSMSQEKFNYKATGHGPFLGVAF